MFNQALKIAYEAHDGQFRRETRVPYIVHPIRVSLNFNDDFRKTIAILHDVIEDTDVTINDLVSQGFPGGMLKILDILTKKDGEKHLDYIRNVAKSEVAKVIKMADIVDNLSDALSVQPESLIKRYNQSLKILINK